jgi:hypothetical protein
VLTLLCMEEYFTELLYSHLLFSWIFGNCTEEDLWPILEFLLDIFTHGSLLIALALDITLLFQYSYSFQILIYVIHIIFPNFRSNARGII